MRVRVPRSSWPSGSYEPGGFVVGVSFKIGSPTNSVFAGVASRRLATKVGFLEYMAAALPFVLLLVPLIWWVLWRKGRRDALGPGQGVDVIQRELSALGPLSGGEKVVGSVFLVAALVWNERGLPAARARALGGATAGPAVRRAPHRLWARLGALRARLSTAPGDYWLLSSPAR